MDVMVTASVCVCVCEGESIRVKQQTPGGCGMQKGRSMVCDDERTVANAAAGRKKSIRAMQGVS